jgi:hypothetical protein
MTARDEAALIAEGRAQRAAAEAKVAYYFPTLAPWVLSRVSLDALLRMVRNAERRGGG